jgi:hypothetical protein
MGKESSNPNAFYIGLLLLYVVLSLIGVGVIVLL